MTVRVALKVNGVDVSLLKEIYMISFLPEEGSLYITEATIYDRSFKNLLEGL